MIINNLRMLNFKSHKDTNLTFDTGINVILGENGAGKTSVLEAISFALFKDYTGNLDDLIKRGNDSMTVVLTFTSHGRRYKVSRKRKKNSTESSLFLIQETEDLLQSGDSAVDSEIEEILGIDRYLFINAVYVRQGEIARLLVSRPSDKKQLIGKLLGIDVLEKVWERMRVIIDQYKEEKGRTEAAITEEGKMISEYSNVNSELIDVKNRIDKTLLKIADAVKDLKAYEAEENKLIEEEKKNIEIKSKMESLAFLIKNEKEKLLNLRNESGKIREAEKEIKEIEKALFPGWKHATEKEISDLKKRVSSIDENTGKSLAMIAESHDLEENLSKAKNNCPVCKSVLTEYHRKELLMEKANLKQKLNSDVKKLKEEKSVVEKKLYVLNNRKEKFIGLEKDLDDKKNIIEKVEGVNRELDHVSSSIKKNEIKLDSFKKMLSKFATDKDAYETVRRNVSSSRTELIALKEAHGKQEGKYQELKNFSERLKEVENNLKDNKARNEKIEKFVNLLVEIRKLFDKSGLQKELRIKSGPVIQDHMRDFFRFFNFDYSDLSLDDNYDVTLFGPSGETTSEMISGGERIAAALALRLGIARTLVGGSAESMMLDEPTIFLDNQRRQDLIEVLKKVSLMPQLIIVTHDTTMEEAADTITFVKKNKGVSFIQ